METDCSYLIKGRDPSRTLKKALALLEHQVTKDDLNRQLKIIDHYLLLSKNGFFVRDLRDVMYFFEILRKKLLNEPSFQDTINQLLNLCLIPPILTRSSEVIMFTRDIQEYFSWLGYMIVLLDDEEDKIKIIKAIVSLLTYECPQRNHLSLAERRKKAYESKLADLLGDLLEIVEDNVYYELLKVLEVLVDKSQESKETCEKFLKKNVVSVIITRLEPTWKERFPSIKPNLPTGLEDVPPHTERTFYVLSTLLARANESLMRAPSKFTIWSLQWAFRLFSLREATCVERNNVLAVLLLIMDVYPDLLFGNLTFAYDIAMLAMSRDIVFRPNWTSDVVLTPIHEDLSCMALLFMCITYFPNFLSGPKVIDECRIVMGLLKVISQQQTIKWQHLQLCYLIRLSLNVLYLIVPASTEEFIEDGGPPTILGLLNRARDNPDTYSYRIVIRSVELLNHISRISKSVRDSIVYNGGVTCILGLIERFTGTMEELEDKQMLLCVCFSLLEKISDESDAFKIIPVIVNYIDQKYINPEPKDQVQNPKLIVICISFIWQKVTSSITNSEEFVRLGGVYLLLDCAQIGCLPVKLVALGSLIDLCEQVQCIPYMITWRRKGQGIKSLLMTIFRNESKMLETKTDENGIMLDTDYPLMGESQYYETYCPCDKHVGNIAVADLYISCRPKVYCILEILNKRQKDTVDLANDVYKVYVDTDELPVADKVTNILAENFLAIKLGEVWNEIYQDLKKMNIIPIPVDKYALKIMIELAKKWASDLKRMQQGILNGYKLKQEEKGRILYNTLRDARLSDAWDALCEMKYMARCSERLFRVTTNFNRHSEIDKNLELVQTQGQMHKTSQSTLSVTCMYNQTIEIPDERCEDSMIAFQPIIVSPISSIESSPRFQFEYEPEGEYLPETLENAPKSRLSKTSNNEACIKK